MNERFKLFINQLEATEIVKHLTVQELIEGVQIIAPYDDVARIKIIDNNNEEVITIFLRDLLNWEIYKRHTDELLEIKGISKTHVAHTIANGNYLIIYLRSI